MESYFERIKKSPIKYIETLIERQKSEIKILERDLKRMEEILQEKKR